MTSLSAVAAVPAAWEKFPTRANTEAWRVYDFSNLTYYYPNWDSTPGNEHAWLYHYRDWALEFSADRFVANGALVGNFAAANVDSITTDVFIEDLDEFEEVDCAIFTKGPDGVERWYYSVPYTWQNFSSDGWQRNLRFGMEEGWSYYNGSKNITVVPDATFLSSIKHVAVTFFPAEGSTLNARAGIDNFVLEPKLLVPPLATSHTAATFSIAFTPAPGLSADLRQMTTTSPFTWSDVPGQTFITGPAQHVFSTPIDAPVEIFRVVVFADYFPIVTSP